MTHPGVGPLTALAYVSIIGTPTRFRRAKQIGTYVGMIPSEDSSAGKQRLGHISEQGNSLLRFLLVEAAQAAARIHPDWRRRYIHLALRRHTSIAKVAMGRRLAIRLYWMWRNGCEYSQLLEFGSYAGPLDTGHSVKQSVVHMMGHPAPCKREFEEVIMVEVLIEEMSRSDRSRPRDYETSRGR
jgi:transposase